MISKTSNFKSLLLSTVMILTFATVSVAQKVPSPEDVFGFRLGSDYKLADYSQIEDYLIKLDNPDNPEQSR